MQPFPADLTTHDAHFKLTIGILPTKSSVEKFPLCRHDYPLRSPINKGGFHALKGKKIWSKVSQKTNCFPVSAHFISLSLSITSSAVEDPT
jgi:hypothetical protein